MQHPDHDDLATGDTEVYEVANLAHFEHAGPYEIDWARATLANFFIRDGALQPIKVEICLAFTPSLDRNLPDIVEIGLGALRPA